MHKQVFLSRSKEQILYFKIIKVKKKSLFLYFYNL